MPLSAEDIVGHRFGRALRGLNQREVEVFLRVVADEHRAALERADEAEKAAARLKAKLDQGDRLVRAADDLYSTAQERLRHLEAERDAAVARAEAAEREAERARAQGADTLDSDAARTLGQEVTQVLRAAHEASASIRAVTENWAEETRQASEATAASLRAEADDYSRSLRAEAEDYSRSLRAEAEQAAEELLREADENAHEALTAARDQAEALLAEAASTVERLQQVEARVRGWLESVAALAAHALEPVGDDEPPVIDTRSYTPPALTTTEFRLPAADQTVG
jgi:DivIVA domain-containing protein